MRRLTGNHGVAEMGVGEKKEKAKRTPRRSFVLGAVVEQMLDEIALDRGVARSEALRSIIVEDHKRRGL